MLTMGTGGSNPFELIFEFKVFLNRWFCIEIHIFIFYFYTMIVTNLDAKSTVGREFELKSWFKGVWISLVPTNYRESMLDLSIVDISSFLRKGQLLILIYTSEKKNLNSELK
jgi:hypothetical protein